MIESVALFGPSFRVRRSYRASAGGHGMSRLTVIDDVTNIRPEPAPRSMMYHFNLGAPLGTGW